MLARRLQSTHFNYFFKNCFQEMGVLCYFGREAATPIAAVWGIFCVVEVWGKVAKPPQNETKQKMSL